ncbi:hypothetical protein KUW17_20275 [Leisingera aquaemixtae]|uniref:hypothetical protein n=1 Tax=Leisingera aquaemixtae TaxID=1396826 RepID=UPI001C94B155|nr:hypothetical protein [Leisingera aquaemixtae]MBY6069091.1 hypothetical protein [Leisingera aquaemixtae]
MKESFPLEDAGAGKGLLVWAADAELQSAVGAALDAAAISVTGELPETAGPDGPALLLMCRPAAETLCRSLEAGQQPGAALEAWQAQAQQVLALQRRCRARVRIVDASALRRAPEAFLALCGQPAGGAAEQRLRAASGPAPSPVLLELAQSCLAASPELRRLAGELAAAAALAGGARAGDPEAALQAYLQQQDSLQELELLQSQQRSMYEQMEGLYGEKLQLEQRLEQMRSGLEAYQALEARLEGLTERLAAKEAALKEAGAVIAGLEQAAAGKAGEAAALKQEAETLRAEIRRFEMSRSYRLTAPLRRLRRALRGGR